MTVPHPRQRLTTLGNRTTQQPIDALTSLFPRYGKTEMPIHLQRYTIVLTTVFLYSSTATAVAQDQSVGVIRISDRGAASGARTLPHSHHRKLLIPCDHRCFLRGGTPGGKVLTYLKRSFAPAAQTNFYKKFIFKTHQRLSNFENPKGFFEKILENLKI